MPLPFTRKRKDAEPKRSDREDANIAEMRALFVINHLQILTRDIQKSLERLDSKRVYTPIAKES